MLKLDKVLNISNKIYEHRWSTAIRKGLLLSFPIIIFGAFSTLLQNIQVGSYVNFMKSTLGSDWQKALYYINDTTLGVLSLCLSVTISYILASSYKYTKGIKINPIIVSLVSLVSYLMLTMSRNHKLLAGNNAADGIFLAILTSLVSVELFAFLSQSKHLNLNNIRMDEEPALSDGLVSIIPTAIILSLFFILSMISSVLGSDSVNDLINQAIGKVFFKISNPLLFFLAYIFVNQILWFFGLHGNFVLLSVADKFLGKTDSPNCSSVASQLSGHIITKSFLDCFVLIGGSGATICLLIAIFIGARKSNTSKVAKISLIPGIFNINEIIVFGLPVVLNPIFLVPFLITPVVLAITAFSAIKLGFVPHAVKKVSWITPPIFNSCLSTGSWRGAALQIFNIGIGTLIYLPFVRLNEKNKDAEITKTFHEMVRIFEAEGFCPTLILTERNDKVGNLARALSKEIKKAITNDELILEYQPQVDINNSIIGVEALLRWAHPKLGRVPPCVIIALAEEMGLINDLGRWVIRKACSQLGEWESKGISVNMSINVSPTQLHDRRLPEVLEKSVREFDIHPDCIELEITESLPVDIDSLTKEILERMKTIGVKLAMDDFGMGYTSLLYMRYFSIDTIKIDGSLTRNMLKDKSCQDIISSMIYLCNSMNINVIAEYVETEGQKELLNSLGCRRYQGYLFSPSLPSDKCVDFIRRLEQQKGVNSK